MTALGEDLGEAVFGRCETAGGRVDAVNRRRSSWQMYFTVFSRGLRRLQPTQRSMLWRTGRWGERGPAGDDVKRTAKAARRGAGTPGAEGFRPGPIFVEERLE